MKRVLIVLSAALVLLWCAGPLLWQFLTSIKTGAQLTQLPPILPEDPTIANYRAVFERTQFPRFIANSVAAAFLSTVFSLILGSLAAFALTSLRFRYRSAVLAFVLSASMLPAVATVSPLYMAASALGLRDSLTALIVLHTAFSLPLSIWILTGFFQAVPKEITSAARVDGCTSLQLFGKIVLPLSRPGLASTSMLVFLYSWNEFLYALTFTASPSSRTVPVGIALFPGLYEMPWGEITAAAMTAVLPPVLMILLFSKWIVEGLKAGAVKG